MDAFITYLVSGLALGGSFALVGSGIVVVYRVTRVVNFAQGTFAVFGGFLSYSITGRILPPGMGEAASVAICAAIGLLVGLAAIGRRSTPPTIALLVTLGMSMLGAAVVVAVWGQNPVSPPGLTGTIDVFGATIQTQRVLVFVVAVISFAFLGLFFGRTDLGRALTASASNPRAARLVGIDTRAMGLVSFAIAGALGGLAGVLIAPSTALSASSDLSLALSGFAAAVFGGLRSPWLTFLGAVVLGVAGQLVAGYLNGSFQTQLALAMMLVIMIARAGTMTMEEAK